MGTKTEIAWTDATWNPTTGCSRVSEGCRNCYIERTPPFRMAGRKLGDPVQLHPDRLDAPLHWKKPRRVFVNSLSDLFHEEVPNKFIAAIFGVMAASPEHSFQVLTKRPERMLSWFQWVQSHRSAMTRELIKQGGAWPKIDEYSAESLLCAYSAREVLEPLSKIRFTAWPLPNVWIGVSVEDQKTADERIPILLEVPAAVRFLSVEPLLSRVDLSFYFTIRRLGGVEKRRWIDWIIVGGESGPKARHCNISWIRSIVRQCQSAAVPCFVKQLGDYVLDRNDAGFDGEMPTDWPMDTDVDDPANEWGWQGAKIRVRLSRKGGNPDEWPSDLRVREFPS